MTDYDIKRNYRDKPWVMPPGAGPLTGEWREGYDRRSGRTKRWWHSPDAKPYSRMSGVASALKGDSSGLVDWAACQAAVGMVLNESARSDVITLINEYDGDPWGNGDNRQRSAKTGKDRLKEAVNRARDTAGQNKASSAGTEFHKLGELVNKGKTPRYVQDHLRPLLDHYVKAVEPLEFLHQELFVVQDELERAGSFDYLIRLPDGRVVVADLKTGKWDAKYPLSVTTQVAGYGTSLVYNQETGERTPIHPNLDPDTGLLVHFPILGDDPKVRFYELDLKVGLRAALIAKQVDGIQAEFNSKAAELKEITF